MKRILAEVTATHGKLGGAFAQLGFCPLFLGAPCNFQGVKLS